MSTWYLCVLMLTIVGMESAGKKALRMTLGANVRAERYRRGMSQEALAEFLEITPRYLAGIERGERNMSLDSIEALAGLLEVDPHALVARAQ